MDRQYDEIVSLGSQCDVGLSLRSLGIKEKTYPFDWVCSNTKIVYDVLLNGPKQYATLGQKNSDDFYTKDLDERYHLNFPSGHINAYGQHFTHYTHMSQQVLIETLSRYLDRFFSLLNSDKKVLFVCSHEEYLYHKISRDKSDLFYDYLCRINDHISEKFPRLNFTILNIDIRNSYVNYKNIVNTSVEYAHPFSDGETRSPVYFEPYRDSVTIAIKNFLYEHVE